jgi:photosystem II stability/assembly factor-like uncharacterized protein
MKRQWLALVLVVLSLTVVAMGLVCVADLTGLQNLSGLAWAAAPEAEPTIIEVDPSSAPNDLDAPIVITGTSFEDGAGVLLDGTSLEDVSWVSGTRLEATVPWGMDPGIYDLTVVNPGGESNDLPNAFTATQGIGVWNAGKLYGGGVNEIVVNPLTPTTVYAVSGDVGMFRSRDSGESWSFKVSGYTYSVRHLAIDAFSPSRLYMFAPWALHRSDDEGDTWIPLDTRGEAPYPHPTIAGTVYAGNRWEESSGLWKSEDYGQTWITVTTGLADTQVDNLVFHPTDPMTMYLGTRNGNLFRSIDGSESWSYVARPVNGEWTLTINPHGAHELWASNACMSMPNFTLKSTNVEHTEWITVADPVGSLACRFIDFAPVAWGSTYSGTIFAGGCWGPPYKTTDGGDTWEAFGPGTGGNGDVALHPTDPNTIYVGGGGEQNGVYKTTDGGATWQAVNQGLTAMYPIQMATVEGQPDVVYAVMEGNTGGIYKATGGGEEWEFLDTEWWVSSVLADPFTPGRVYAGYSERVYRSDDGGYTWPTSGTLVPPDVCLNVQAFMPEVLRADPEQPGTLLAGVHGYCNDFTLIIGDIHRSIDGGLTWTTTLTAGQIISRVHDIAYDREITTVVYAATDGTGMLRSTDSGQSWQRVSEGIAALDQVSSIAVEPFAPYRVFVRNEGPERGLYVSEDHGMSWTEAPSPLGHLIVEQILCTEDQPSVLYAATNEGLLRSSDGGQSWSHAAGVLGQVPVYSLAIVRDGERVILYAGTTGGFVEDSAAGPFSQVNAEGTLVSAGVYRYTTLRRWWVYLPLVVRQSP